MPGINTILSLVIPDTGDMVVILQEITKYQETGDYYS
jgi:hypothetical protein